MCLYMSLFYSTCIIFSNYMFLKLKESGLNLGALPGADPTLPPDDFQDVVKR